MKSLIAVLNDGVRHLITTVPVAFDTQAWANQRVKAFRFLGIVKIIEEYHNEKLRKL